MRERVNPNPNPNTQGKEKKMKKPRKRYSDEFKENELQKDEAKFRPLLSAISCIITPAKRASAIIMPKSPLQHLETQQYHFGIAPDESKVRQVNGLAWTETGGKRS